MPTAYLAVLCAAALCYAALGAALPVLPWLAGIHLGGGPVAVGLAVGAPSLTGALLRPVGGRLADRAGPFPVLLAGSLLMAAGVAPAFVPDLGALVGSRLAVGGGEALMMSAAVLWLLRLAGPARRGRALGHIGLANYAGLAVGPLLADAVGSRAYVGRLWILAAALPLLGATLASTRRGDTSGTTASRLQDAGRRRVGETGLVRLILRPAIGLVLVNVGYVALLSFGAAAAAAHGLGIGALIVPLFGIGVIASRTLLASVPDRWGAARTLTAAAWIEAAGLAAVGVSGGEALTIAALLALAVGQGLAVPSLGLLALSRVDAARQGAAAGLFFVGFDMGVGLGGPLIGLAAAAAGPVVALLLAAAAVAAAVPVVLLPAERCRTSGGTEKAAKHGAG